MGASLAPQWIFQALTDAGKVADGALLYSYVAGGGTVPAPLIADDGVSPLANPLEFDAAGRAKFNLDDSKSYRLVLKDKNGVTLFDRDNVFSATSTTLGFVKSANLADQDDAGKGAALSGYKGRTVYDRLSESLTLRDFGAIGDGIANDTDAVQDALLSGMHVLVTPGTYLVDSLVSSVAGTCLVGAGGVIQLRNASNIEKGVSITADNVEFDGVTFDGGGLVPGKSFSARTLIAIESVDSCKIRNCTIRNHVCSRELSYVPALLIDPDGCTNFDVSGNTFDNIKHETASLVNGTGFVEGIFVYNPSKSRQDQISIASYGKIAGNTFRDVVTVSTGGAGILTVADSDCVRFYVSDPSNLTTPSTTDLVISFGSNLVAGDVISSAIEGITVAQVTFATDHATTMAAWGAAISAAVPLATVSVVGTQVTVGIGTTGWRFVRGYASIANGGSASANRATVVQNRLHWGISIENNHFVNPQKRPLKMSGAHGIRISGVRVTGNAPGQFCATMVDVRQSVDVSISDVDVIAWGLSIAELHGKNITLSGVSYNKPEMPEPYLTALNPIRTGAGLRYGIVRMYDKPFADAGGFDSETAATVYTTDSVTISNVNANSCGCLLYVDGSTTGVATNYMDSTANYAAKGYKPLNNITLSQCRADDCGSNRLYQINGFTCEDVQVDGKGTECAFYAYDMDGTESFDNVSINTGRYAMWFDRIHDKIALNNIRIRVPAWVTSVNQAILYPGSSSSASIKEVFISDVQMVLPTYNAADLSPTTNKAFPFRTNNVGYLKITNMGARWTGTKALANLTNFAILQNVNEAYVDNFHVRIDDPSGITQTPYIVSILGTVGRVSVTNSGSRYLGIEIQAATTVARLSASGIVATAGVQLALNSGTLTSNQATAAGVTW